MGPDIRVHFIEQNLMKHLLCAGAVLENSSMQSHNVEFFAVLPLRCH